MKLTYIGHSAFLLEHAGYGVLVDPFITGNPIAQFDKSTTVSDIFLTHGHGDHLGDAIPLSFQKKVPITAIFELANYCSSKGVQTNSVNIGAKLEYDWGTARFFEATHSSSTPDGNYAGTPCGILFEIDGIKIYHAGDTGLNPTLKMIGKLYSPDVALLPVGGNFTMGIEEAAIAAEWLKVKKVIPMHYNTFDAIKLDINDFATKFPLDIKCKCRVLSPGEFIHLEAN